MLRNIVPLDLTSSYCTLCNSPLILTTSWCIQFLSSKGNSLKYANPPTSHTKEFASTYQNLLRRLASFCTDLFFFFLFYFVALPLQLQVFLTPPNCHLAVRNHCFPVIRTITLYRRPQQFICGSFKILMLLLDSS